MPRWQDGSLQNCNIDMFTAQHGGLTVNPRPMALFKHNEVCFCPWILNFELSSLSPSPQKRQNTLEKYIHIGYPRPDIPLNLPKNHQDRNLWCQSFWSWFHIGLMFCLSFFLTTQFLKDQLTNPHQSTRGFSNASPVGAKPRRCRAGWHIWKWENHPISCRDSCITCINFTLFSHNS